MKKWRIDVFKCKNGSVTEYFDDQYDAIRYAIKMAQMEPGVDIFILENNDLEDRKNAFDSMIYLKYKEENLINDNMKNICITRLIYLLEENLDKVDSLKIEFEIDGAMKVFEM